MEPCRLILVPQMRVRLRYQEWWFTELLRWARETFQAVIVLGDDEIRLQAHGQFSSEVALRYEMRQLDQYLGETIRRDDILLHMDLSYPGLFHSVLAHRRPERSAVFCHATSKNSMDYFSSCWEGKWPMEKGAAALYGKVLVASRYHERRLGLLNTVRMGALPQNPAMGLRPQLCLDRLTFGSVARNAPQKSDRVVEAALEKLSGETIRRPRPGAVQSWDDYWHFLDTTKFLVLTPKEETYGYAAAEALARGCIPIAPRAYSYPELLPGSLLYSQDQGPIRQAEQIMAIAEAWDNKPAPELLCKREQDSFWDTLREVLTKW